MGKNSATFYAIIEGVNLRIFVMYTMWSTANIGHSPCLYNYDGNPV